jgi:hypothetical protein
MKPATDEQMAGISFTDDGVISPWQTRNEAMRALIARIKAEQDDMNSAQQQIDKLAKFIMAEVPGEPSESESAVDCAIRIITADTLGNPPGPPAGEPDD